MELITVVLLLIVTVYAIFIAQLIYGFDKVKSFERKNITPKTKFSVVVPFRNEAKNLPKLLKSISNLNYPKELIQIIMVDDFSDDYSSQIYNQWRMDNDKIDTTLLENLHLSNSPKKDAISRAFPIAKHEWIVTTDADCIVPKNWLLTLDNYIQKNTVEMIVGAVIYKTKNNWFHHFQQLDLLSLQGTTVGSFGLGKPFMCNGANFAYTKKLFNELGGFGGINDIASGDDVMLLQKAVKNNIEHVRYLKSRETIVKTKPENDLFKVFMQRVRWASKATGYDTAYSKILAVVVLFSNVSLVAGLLLCLFNYLNWKILFGVFLIKYSVDSILLLKSNSYLRKGKFILPLASSLFYPIFCSLVGIYSLFGRYTWKGRNFKK